MIQSVTPVKILIEVIDSDLQEEAGAKGQREVQRVKHPLIDGQRRPHQQRAYGRRQRKWPRHLKPDSPRRPDIPTIRLCIAHSCSLISDIFKMLISYLDIA